MTAPADFGQLPGLFGHVLLTSLLAVGGALSTVPELRRVMVADMGLLSDAQFHASIAIAQASPGPNVLFIAVLGYQVAGVAGAALLLIGFLLPSTTLAYAGLRWGTARGESRAARAFKAATAPLVIALMLASGWILAAEAPGIAHWLGTALVALAAWLTRVHVLVLIGAACAAGAAGWI